MSLDRWLLDHCSGDLGDARAMIDRYAGAFQNLTDFVLETLEEISTIPEHLAPYLDTDAIGQAMANHGEIDVIHAGFDRTLVFWSH